MVAGTSAMMLEGTNVELVVVESVRSEAAQQSSACAWLTACLLPECWDSDLCIGHAASSLQHAMRASGDACQPAQTARFAPQSVRTATIATSRRLSTTTFVGCWMRGAVSNRTGRTAFTIWPIEHIVLCTGCADHAEKAASIVFADVADTRWLCGCRFRYLRQDDGHRDLHTSSSTWLGMNLQRTAQRLDALPHADETKTFGRHRIDIEPDPVVDNRNSRGHQSRTSSA